MTGCGIDARSRAVSTIAFAGLIFIGNAFAQDESAKALAERSAIVVEGKVLRANASLESNQPASPLTVVITITRMYSGEEIAGDQKGRTATVILSRPRPTMKTGTEAIFFGNPRFVGKSLTIASEGELPIASARSASSDLNVGLQSRRDRPLRERIEAASSVFEGRVESERALSAPADQPGRLREPPSEHDPEWHVAAVRVVTALKGSERGALVNVIFPASRDIMWFNAPKLMVGQELVFITHKPSAEDTRLMRAPGVAEFLERQPAEVVSEPFDTVPASDVPRVRNVLEGRR